MCIWWCLCPWRIHYTYRRKLNVERINLFFAFYPVLVGNAIARSFLNVTLLLAHQNESLIIGIYALFSILVCYLGGKTLMYTVITRREASTSIDTDEPWNYLPDVAAETCGFAFTNLFLRILFNYALVDIGLSLGAIFGLWLVCAAAVVAVVLSADLVQSYIFSNEEISGEMLEFDGDCFSLPLAYSLQVIACLGLHIGGSYSIIYSWRGIDNNDDEWSQEFEIYEFIYALGLTVAAVLLEFALDLWHGPEDEIVAGDGIMPRVSSVPDLTRLSTFMSRFNGSITTCRKLFFNTCRGYFVGLAWVMSILDEIYFSGEFGIIVLGLFVSYITLFSVPMTIVDMMKILEESEVDESREREMLARLTRTAPRPSPPTNDIKHTHPYIYEDNTRGAIVVKNECCRRIFRGYHRGRTYSIRLGRQWRRLMMIVARLVVGFCYEEMIFACFELMSEEGLAVGMQCAAAAGLFMTGFYFFRSLKRIQRRLDTPLPPSDVELVEGGKSKIIETPSPLNPSKQNETAN